MPDFFVAFYYESINYRNILELSFDLHVQKYTLVELNHFRYGHDSDGNESNSQAQILSTAYQNLPVFECQRILKVHRNFLKCSNFSCYFLIEFIYDSKLYSCQHSKSCLLEY